MQPSLREDQSRLGTAHLQYSQRRRSQARFFTATLLQLRVFRLGLLQDRDIGVGVFPEGKKVLVCTFRFRGVACHRVGATDLQMH